MCLGEALATRTGTRPRHNRTGVASARSQTVGAPGTGGEITIAHLRDNKDFCGSLGEEAGNLAHASTKARASLNDTPMDVWRLQLLEQDRLKLESVRIFFVVSAAGRPFAPQERSRGFLGDHGGHGGNRARGRRTGRSSSSSSSSALSHAGTGSLLGTGNTTSSEQPEATLHPSSSSGGPPSSTSHPDDARSAGKDARLIGGKRTDRIIIYTSSWISDLTGYPSHEFLGRDCRFLQGPATDRRTVAKIAAALNRNESIQAMLLNYRKDQTPFWNLLSLDPLRNRDGEVVATLGVQKDATELVRLYLERMRAQLQFGRGVDGLGGAGEYGSTGGSEFGLRLTASSLAAHDVQVREIRDQRYKTGGRESEREHARESMRARAREKTFAAQERVGEIMFSLVLAKHRKYEYLTL